MGEICSPDGIPDDEGDEESEESEEVERSAAEIAEFLSTYVSASRQQALLEIVAGAAAYYAEDAERGALWDEVYDLLSE